MTGEKYPSTTPALQGVVDFRPFHRDHGGAQGLPQRQIGRRAAHLLALEVGETRHRLLGEDGEAHGPRGEPQELHARPFLDDAVEEFRDPGLSKLGGLADEILEEDPFRYLGRIVGAGSVQDVQRAPLHQTQHLEGRRDLRAALPVHPHLAAGPLHDLFLKLPEAVVEVVVFRPCRRALEHQLRGRRGRRKETQGKQYNDTAKCPSHGFVLLCVILRIDRDGTPSQCPVSGQTSTLVERLSRQNWRADNRRRTTERRRATVVRKEGKVARDRIELPTRGFSVLCSTNLSYLAKVRKIWPIIPDGSTERRATIRRPRGRAAPA